MTTENESRPHEKNTSIVYGLGITGTKEKISGIYSGEFVSEYLHILYCMPFFFNDGQVFVKMLKRWSNPKKNPLLLKEKFKMQQDNILFYTRVQKFYHLPTKN